VNTALAKTKETLELERKIYFATQNQGTFGCHEVTIGWFGKERVDYMTYDTKGIWRCYEIKVSKSDFHSKARNTFVGHFNYYVMPKHLYEEVKDEIPDGVGVHDGTCVLKNPKKRELAIDTKILYESMIRSLHREYHSKLRNEFPGRAERLEKELKQEKFRHAQSERSISQNLNAYFKENQLAQRFLRSKNLSEEYTKYLDDKLK
jgi:hypothetical protein